MSKKGKRNSILGTFQAASPGFAGIVHSRVLIWPPSPISLRKLQDQFFILSPETIERLGDNFSKKLSGVNGYDGVFLTPNYKLQHNFIAAKIKKESEDPSARNNARSNESKDNVIPLTSLRYYNITDENPTALFFNFNTEENTTNISVCADRASQLAHQTWIVDGSLFSNQSFTEDELLFNELDDEITRYHKQFHSFWEYRLPNEPPTRQSKDGTVTSSENDNFKLFPRQVKVSPNDPIQAMEDLDVKEEFTNDDGETFYDANPGVHWRVLKRTPLFQNEDFFIDFRRTSRDTDIANKNGGKWRLLEKFKYLDVHTDVEPDTEGVIQNLGIVELDSDLNKKDDSLDTFDFSDQSYYIIEIGVDSAEHNYYLILSQRAAPIFCHAGKFHSIVPDEESQDNSGPETEEDMPDGEEDDNEDPNKPNFENDCGTDQASQIEGESSSSAGRRTKVVLPKVKQLRRLSTYSLVRASRLMDQDNLRITFRQHLGRLMITFSGYEDEPWVIERKDLLPTPNVGEGPIQEDDLQSEFVPIVIPNKQIAIMGGNRVTSFHFAPLTYQDGFSEVLSQTISVQGPVDFKEIQTLLRDKGSSRNPQDASNQNSDQNAVNFSQDAAVFKEHYRGKKQIKESIRVQPSKTENFGKAPDVQKTNDFSILFEGFERTSDVRRSMIAVEPKDCSKRKGSDSPYVKSIQVSLSLFSGDYPFKAPKGDSEMIEGGEEAPPWILKSCITPIATFWRLFVPPFGRNYDTAPIDVGHHMMSLQDSWTEKDLLSINHTGTIQFLVNQGMDDVFTDDNPNHANYLRSLTDKNFYIQISCWWGEDNTIDSNEAETLVDAENNIFSDRYTQEDLKDSEGTIMPKPQNERDRVIFTGICSNSRISVENNREILTCDVSDYTKILEDQIFLNSPFFDKMRDFNAISEILQIASFRTGREFNEIDNQPIGNLNTESDGIDNTMPSSLLARLAASDKDGWFQIVHNGEVSYNQEYALPGSYNILHEPFFKFDDGANLYEAIEKISRIAGKTIYFDRLGVFHYEKLPYDQALFNGQQGSSSNFSIKDWEALSKIDYIASPRDLLETEENQANEEEAGEGGDGEGDEGENEEDKDKSCEIHRQVFDSYEIIRDMDSVINEIRVVSSTPNGEALLAGHTNFDSLNDNTKSGFVGYPKTLLVMDGVFGSESNVKWIVKHYTKLFLPPVTIKFKTLGHNKLKPLDVITFRGLGWSNKQVLIISSLSNEINAQDNSWWQSIEGYWIFPSQDIIWGNQRDVYIGNDIV